ncbi:MAG: STAS-like domain-containing protein [Acidimicrobiia bacterium]
MKRPKVKDIALRLLTNEGRITSGELARAAGVSRQTAHAALSVLVQRGMAQPVGAGRGAHYLPTGVRSYRWSNEGLEEHRVWAELLDGEPLSSVRDPARSILEYAVSEMVNNVIDHSLADTVTVRVGRLGNDLTITIEDDGVGVFAKIQEEKSLESHLDALSQLSKGKLTTDPARHTGEGIFFASKAVDVFTLVANNLEWIIDNRLVDVAVGTASRSCGTAVTLRHDPTDPRTLESVFAAYTTDFEFDTSQVIVRLFEHGDSFVSRSQARRIAAGLEKFRRVIVDFAGIQRVGQGFVDELFRIWSAAHPETALEPINMNPAVKFMVHRGLPQPYGPQETTR